MHRHLPANHSRAPRQAVAACAAAIALVVGSASDSNAGPASKASAKEVVANVQRFYQRTTNLTAKFRQEYTNATFENTSRSDGRVYVKKPGRMRWDYVENKKVVRSFLSDGKTLWAVEHDNKQVFQKNLAKNMLPVAVTFLLGNGALARDFHASLDDEGTIEHAKDELVLELVPKQPSAQFSTLWLVVNKRDYRVRRSVVLEASKNLNSFTFYEPDTKTAIPGRLFDVNIEALGKKYRVIK